MARLTINNNSNTIISTLVVVAVVFAFLRAIRPICITLLASTLSYRFSTSTTRSSISFSVSGCLAEYERSGCQAATCVRAITADNNDGDGDDDDNDQRRKEYKT